MSDASSTNEPQAPQGSGPVTPEPVVGGAPYGAASTAEGVNVQWSATSFATPQPRNRTQAVVRSVVAGLMVAAAIAGQVAGAGFPSNAPVEMFMNFGVTVALVLGAIALVVFAVLAATAPGVPVRPEKVGPLAIIGVLMTAIPSVIWLLTVPITLVDNATTGATLRFMYLSGPAFWLGFAWVTGMVFGAISLRRPNALTRVLGSAAVVLGLLLATSVVWAAAIYSAGLTE
ncbi:hypothetical protein M2152_000554 [Microbacteriaceae bacterium SG_E_30_P1]|uniref:Yip1 domain-containing protein n=1 Tax=Antiquaquibacter oligotrophicus TaxID=2880260 RepID=A0ABT6KMN9_9MICO|nr:hypothetical protein [Antiquaquibacter oligotrophicus]MDH6180372.1 hypothetical protein [Antiquaquibacter oligotrophicus]UDF13886.1 hypothetical protein LH407_03245 [Antiquaquibacter oligotrophicus]